MRHTTELALEYPFRVLGHHIAVDLDGGHALFTTRRGGVSEGPFASLNLASCVRGGSRESDEPALVSENRRVLARELELELERFCNIRQVHGNHVECVLEAPGDQWSDPRAEDLPTADGQATALPHTPLVVLAADCLPIALIADGAVAMIHAGWRGLASGVLGQGASSMRGLGVKGPIAAAVGPGAGRCCYEVSEELQGVFSQYGPEVRNARNLDLKRVAVLQLQALGVTEVHDLGLCTICSDSSLFFSHRRDAGHTGRHAGIVWRSS